MSKLIDSIYNMRLLDELAQNMWWSWNYEARDLFAILDADLFEEVGQNPVLLLERLSYERKEEIVKDKSLMKKVFPKRLHPIGLALIR